MKGWRNKAGTLALATALITGVLVAAQPVAAGAQTISHTFVDVLCTSTAGNQLQTITVEITAPDAVVEGSTFTVSFPGGDAVLPPTGAGFTITSYANLSTTFQMQLPGTFVAGTESADGPTTIDTGSGPVVTSGTGTVIAPDKFKIAELGPFAPGTLHTPTWSVNATAPLGTAGQNITMNAFQLTTQVRLQGFVVPVAVSCAIPNDTLITIPIIAAGSNTPPTVDAGANVTGEVGTAIALDGTVTDPDNTPTTHWTIDSPSCTFADANAVDTTVTCTLAGNFAATLTANDGVNAPVSDGTQVAATSPNVPPAVDAGPDTSGDVADQISLDGTVTDPDSTPTVLWSIDSPDCTFDDETAVDTTVVCSSAGTFAATLTADDGVNVPVSDSAEVTVNEIPPGLTVSAGPDAGGSVNTAIALDGKVTDPGNTPVISWAIDSPNCVFGSPNAADTTVTCSTGGVFAATITAVDGVNPNGSDTTLVTVTVPNAIPVVDAGPDVTVVKNQSAMLDASVFDPDDTPAIQWFVDSPNCSFGSPTSVDTTITCTTAGVYAAAIQADDGHNPPVGDAAVVTVLDSAPPVVNAGPDTSGNVGDPITLNGSVTDADSTFTAMWSTGAPGCTFADASSPVTTITCTSAAIVAATLTADDGVNVPVSDTAVVTVTEPNVAPFVDAGPNVTTTDGHSVGLDGTVIDPDSTPSVQWSTGNPNCTFADPNSIDTTITCTSLGITAATLTADDGVNAPVHDTTLVTITPKLCTGPCLSVGDVVGYEGATAVIPVTLSDPQPVAVTVKATLVAITAINGSGLPAGSVMDFKSPIVRKLTIIAGARQANISVKALTDLLEEGDETYQVVLSAPVGASIGRSVGLVTIKDSTALASGPLQLLVGSVSIVEPNACGTCKVNASIPVVTSTGLPVTSPVTTRYSTQPGGPTVIPGTIATGGDYQPKTNIAFNFNPPPGLAYKAIVIVILGDNSPENTEDVNVVFSNVVGVPQPPPGVIHIIDND